jgi:hypothetical protein
LTKVFISRILINFYNHINFFSPKIFSEAVASLPQWKLRHCQWRSLGLFSSEAIHRAQRGEKMLGGVQKLERKKGAIETHFPEFKWIIYDFNNNRNKTQKTISICVK